MLNKKWISIVLSIGASVGVVMTAVLAADGATKVEKIAKDSDGAKEKILNFCKCYGPAMAAGSAAIACIIGSGVISTNEQKALLGACIAAREGLSVYQGKVKELCGQSTHGKIIEAIVAEDADEVHMTAGGLFGSSSLDFGMIGDTEVLRTFYDEYSKRYFDSTIEKVLQAEYHLNRNFSLAGCQTLNNFYEFLGLYAMEEGDEIGWGMCSGLQWIDFNHRIIQKNGQEILVIQFGFDPDKELDW